MTFDTSHSTTLNAGHMTAMCVTIQDERFPGHFVASGSISSKTRDILRTYIVPIKETLDMCMGVI